jgi:hypothetical protein
MKTGKELFGSGDLNRQYFIKLKTGQCDANLYLSGFMSQIMMKEIKDTEKQKRFGQLAVIALETIGAGDRTDKDFVEVSKQSLLQLCSQEDFDLEAIRPENPHFAYIVDAAKYHIEEINKILNSFYKTEIDSEEMWGLMGLLFSAYWFETKRSKKQI